MVVGNNPPVGGGLNSVVMEPSSSDSSVAKLDIGDPLYLDSSDTSAASIVIIKLTCTDNYKVWSRAMELKLKTKINWVL